MDDRDTTPFTDTSDARAVVRRFLQAFLEADQAAVAALCTPGAAFVIEFGEGVPVTTYGPNTFVTLYAPRPGLAYAVPTMALHPSPGGAVAVWRMQVYGHGGEQGVFGVSTFYLRDGRIERVETTCLSTGPARTGEAA